MERMVTVGWPGQVGRFRPTQIVQQSTWDGIKEQKVKTTAALHSINVQPSNSSTTTFVNPLDPGDSEDPTNDEWKNPPGSWGTLYPVRSFHA
jgi:hypothetical protein